MAPLRVAVPRAVQDVQIDRLRPLPHPPDRLVRNLSLRLCLVPDDRIGESSPRPSPVLVGVVLGAHEVVVYEIVRKSGFAGLGFPEEGEAVFDDLVEAEVADLKLGEELVCALSICLS